MRFNFKEGNTYTHKNLKSYEYKGIKCGMCAFKPIDNDIECECILFDLSESYKLFSKPSKDKDLEKHLEGQAMIGYKNFKRFKGKPLPITALDRTNNKNNTSALSIQHYLSGRSLEDNSKLSDIGNLEIKAKINSDSFYSKRVSMFTLNPKIDFESKDDTSILNELKHNYKTGNTLLRNVFGHSDSEYNEVMVMCNTVNCKEFKMCNGYYFKLDYDKNSKRFYYHIKDKNNHTISSKDVYFNFSDILSKFGMKSENLLVVNYENIQISSEPMLKMTNSILYTKLDENKILETFLNADISVNTNITVKRNFKDKKMNGKVHDHGTAFNIEKTHIGSMYKYVNMI